jgi:acyl dehydratase
MSASSASMDRNLAYTMANVEHFVGREIGVSSWFEVTQDDTNAFGHATHDVDRNHMDVEWAKENSPFGQPVAFGFQTLSLLTYLGKQAGMVPSDVVEEYNYGLNRIRFSNAVPVGSRVRCRMVLQDVRRRPSGHAIMTFAAAIEIDGEDKPALIGEWLVMCRADQGGD